MEFAVEAQTFDNFIRRIRRIMLKIKNLHAQVGDTKILNGLNLIGPGEFTQSWDQTVLENQRLLLFFQGEKLK